MLKYQRPQRKTDPPAGSQDSVEEHLVQDRDIGDEEAAEQPGTSENEVNVLTRNGEEAPPTYDAVPRIA